MPKLRTTLTKQLPAHSSEIRGLSVGQVILLMAMHDIESMRSASGLPSGLLSWFTNSSLNNNAELSACMEHMAEKAGSILL